jgi:hypothetical protein
VTEAIITGVWCVFGVCVLLVVCVGMFAIGAAAMRKEDRHD